MNALAITTNRELDGLSDYDLIVQSERVLDRVLDILAAMPAPGNAVTLRAGAKAYSEIVAAQVQSREAKLEAQNNLAEARLRTERYLGQQIPLWQEAGILAKAGGDPMSNDTTLDDFQISRDQSSIWQKIGRLDSETFEDRIATAKENGLELSTSGVLRGFRQKPKENRAGDIAELQPYDFCQTPPYALAPLLPYLSASMTIWESAAGEGLLAHTLRDYGCNVVESDILTDQNFFEYEPPYWDVLVTNPPFSIKYDWLARCYELGHPFALLMPVEVLGAAKAQALFTQYDLQVIFMSPRINFKMPQKGWEGGGAQFPTAWFTYRLDLERDMVFARLDRGDYK